MFNNITIIIIILLIILILSIYYILNKNNIINDVHKLSENFKLITKPSKKIYAKKEFYNESIYPELKHININKIRTELSNFIKNNNKWIEWPELDLWKNKDSSSSWKVIPIKAFGKWHIINNQDSLKTSNVSLFPETVKEINKIPNVITIGFSKLGPKTKLSWHQGWAKLSNNVLRCHLGLFVPKNQCKILVSQEDIKDDEPKTYSAMIQEDNKWIIFDDSLNHSASNDSDVDRIVLILDIKRPPNVPLGYSNIEYSEELDNFMNEFSK
jgi:aspartyl/asparaginyl beta-hydroxylase (cupin superfamily)